MSNHDFVPMFPVNRPQSVSDIALPFLALVCRVLGHKYVHGQTVGKGEDGRTYWMGYCERCWRGGYLKGNLQELCPYKMAGGAETGGEKAAPMGKSIRKQWRSYRRRVKRAVLAQMPYREAGEWAADMLQITPLPTESKTKKFAVEFCKIAIKTYEHKEDAEAFQKELHRILRRKLRYYAAQEKRALMCKLAFKDRNPEPTNFRRSSQNQTVASGVEGAHEGRTADKKASKCKHGVSPNQTTACGNCDEEMREYSLSSLSDDSAPKHFEREFLESLLDTLRNSANRFQREGMSCEEVNHQMAELESRLADSREPEKLNNAQKVELCDKCGFPESEFVHRAGSSGDPYHKFVALAESSLSSPPPTSDLSTPTSPAPLSTQPDTIKENK